MRAITGATRGPGDRWSRVTDPERHPALAHVVDDHLAAEFTTRDRDPTMPAMTGDPQLNHVPVRTGRTPTASTSSLPAGEIRR
jgi:hypothetical protein